MCNHREKGRRLGYGDFIGVSEEMIQKAEKRAATVKTRRHSRRRGSALKMKGMCPVPVHRLSIGR
jgi:hypothetical protein